MTTARFHLVSMVFAMALGCGGSDKPSHRDAGPDGSTDTVGVDVSGSDGRTVGDVGLDGRSPDAIQANDATSDIPAPDTAIAKDALPSTPNDAVSGDAAVVQPILDARMVDGVSPSPDGAPVDAAAMPDALLTVDAGIVGPVDVQSIGVDAPAPFPDSAVPDAFVKGPQPDGAAPSMDAKGVLPDTSPADAPAPLTCDTCRATRCASERASASGTTQAQLLACALACSTTSCVQSCWSQSAWESPAPAKAAYTCLLSACADACPAPTGPKFLGCRCQCTCGSGYGTVEFGCWENEPTCNASACTGECQDSCSTKGGVTSSSGGCS